MRSRRATSAHHTPQRHTPITSTNKLQPNFFSLIKAPARTKAWRAAEDKNPPPPPPQLPYRRLNISHLDCEAFKTIQLESPWCRSRSIVSGRFTSEKPARASINAAHRAHLSARCSFGGTVCRCDFHYSHMSPQQYFSGASENPFADPRLKEAGPGVWTIERDQQHWAALLYLCVTSPSQTINHICWVETCFLQNKKKIFKKKEPENQ